jgi:acetyl-CoA acyltransferase
MAADQIRLGHADLMLAGGTESMSMVPMMGNKVAMSPQVFARDENIAIAYGMGITAEKVAEEWNVSREDQDAFAYASHQKAMAAIAGGEFRSEISPYQVISRQPVMGGNTIKLREAIIDTDEGPRADTSLEGLAKLRTVFRNGGSVTAGNSSQMSDGAGAVMLASEKAIKEYGLTPLARFVSFSVAGVRPEVMGIGPIAAIPKALKQAGLTQDQIDWIELNEAFAAQALAVIRTCGLDPSKVNPLGGAIALGHPLGATGAIRTATIVHGMQRRKAKYGMVTMCIGTGMGAAGIFESL